MKNNTKPNNHIDYSKIENFSPILYFIPQQVLEDERLSWFDKVLYSVVLAFTHAKLKKCIASNEVLAKRLKVHPRSVRRALLNLEKRGYIKRIFKDESNRVREEIIPIIPQNTETSIGRTKLSYMTDKNVLQVGQNCPQSNIYLVDKFSNKYKEYSVDKNVRLENKANDLETISDEEYLKTLKEFTENKLNSSKRRKDEKKVQFNREQAFKVLRARILKEPPEKQKRMIYYINRHRMTKFSWLTDEQLNELNLLITANTKEERSVDLTNLRKELAHKTEFFEPKTRTTIQEIVAQKERQLKAGSDGKRIKKVGK